MKFFEAIFTFKLADKPDLKKTTELTDQEIDQLLYLNNTTMNEQRTKKNFQDKYLLNFLGFSFHALMIKNNIIVGCNTVIPQEFIFFDKKCIFWPVV